MKTRKKAWLDYLGSRNSYRLSVYKSARNAVVGSIRKDKAQYQKRIVRQMKRNPMMFYKYMRNKQRNSVTERIL